MSGAIGCNNRRSEDKGRMRLQTHAAFSIGASNSESPDRSDATKAPVARRKTIPPSGLPL
ncbi:protein of unknown function [Paraburkholderia kururiensis]